MLDELESSFPLLEELEPLFPLLEELEPLFPLLLDAGFGAGFGVGFGGAFFAEDENRTCPVAAPYFPSEVSLFLFWNALRAFCVFSPK